MICYISILYFIICVYIYYRTQYLLLVLYIRGIVYTDILYAVYGI